jgi:curved DNA-binding protein CbpA
MRATPHTIKIFNFRTTGLTTTMPMNIRKSFELLEIGMNATEDEAKQAYKDLVSVWHPDRFSHNPRLKKKAEEKLKEANLAFETVKDFFSATGKSDQSRREKASPGESGETFKRKTAVVSKTELAAELGTGAVLTLWSYLSKKVNRMLSDEVKRKRE